jgi:hypothetical protein
MSQVIETEEHTVRIHIDEKALESPNPTTGSALYDLGHVQHGLELFHEVDGNREDKGIANDGSEIRLHQDAHFHIGLPVAKAYLIIVNAEQKEVHKKELTYLEVVALAFPNPAVGNGTVYTVTYKKAAGHPHQGSLVPGGTVEVKDGTIFHVTPTNKS